MEALFNCFIWCSSFAAFIIPFCIWDYFYVFIPLWFFLLLLYPILQEFLFCLFQKTVKSCNALDYDTSRILKKSRKYHYIVYSNDYNITACGLEKWHPFDSTKYGRIYNFLIEWGVIMHDTKIMRTSICPRMYLYEVCTFKHMVLLNYSAYISKCVELPIFFLPAWLIRWRVLNPMLKATYGTIHAAIKAMDIGYSINLSGGYHHACGHSGGGFCIYPDITIAIKIVRKLFSISKVMIIDLDAHQGNGHERDFINDNNIYIIDCFRPDIYPADKYAKRAISKEIHVYPSDDNDSYLDKLSCIPECIDEFKPEFIMYNAGTDIMKGDPLSGLNITEPGVVARDDLVFKSAVNKNIPICMVLSGGYQQINAHCIAKSIQNLDGWLKHIDSKH